MKFNHENNPETENTKIKSDLIFAHIFEQVALLGYDFS